MANDNELSTLRNFIYNSFPTNCSQLSLELKAWQKVISDLYDADRIICINLELLFQVH